MVGVAAQPARGIMHGGGRAAKTLTQDGCGCAAVFPSSFPSPRSTFQSALRICSAAREPGCRDAEHPATPSPAPYTDWK